MTDKDKTEMSVNIVPSGKGDLPTIIVNNRHFRDVLGDAWIATSAANHPEPTHFQRKGSIVRLTDRGDRLNIEPMGVDDLYGFLAHNADWMRQTPDGDLIPTRPDKQVTRVMLARVRAILPELESVLTTPVFGKSANLLLSPGYHCHEAAYLDGTRMLEVPPVSSTPTTVQIQEAKLLLDDVLGDFPFPRPADRAHALGAILLPFVRRLITDCTPLHGVEASVVGSGKSLMVKVVHLIATGRLPEFHTLPTDEDEMRKKITAILSNGPQMIVFDNASQKNAIDSAQLAAALTTTMWSDRILGISRTASLPNFASWFVTGNNPSLSTEIARRYIPIRLDPNSDRPWARKPEDFRHPDLLGWIRDQRARLVWATLTLAQAWIAAGCPKPTTNPLGSFESWSTVIGGILEYVGIDGFLADRDRLYAHADSESNHWREFVAAWWERFKDEPKMTRDLCFLCRELNLLEAVLSEAKGPRGQETALGSALLKMRDRIFMNFRLTLHSDKGHHGRLYRLVPQQPRSGSDSLQGNLGNLGDLFF